MLLSFSYFIDADAMPLMLMIFMIISLQAYADFFSAFILFIFRHCC